MMDSFINLIEGVRNAAVLYPHHRALVAPDRFFTYQQFIEQVEQYAALLLKKANKPRLQRVAIFSFRNPIAYIGTLATLMTGAAYIPLNPRFPTERNIAILKQANPDAIIVDKNSVKELIKIGQQMILPELILFPDFSPEQNYETDLQFITHEESNINTSVKFPEISSENLAYILFTSGSTGQPKGVPITHGNVCSFLKYNQNRYQITPQDRLSQTFDQTFDPSVFDMFMAWCHGASLHIMRPIDLLSPSKYINENKITVWFSVPSIITLLSKQGFLSEGIFPTLRLSLFCGEALLESEVSVWAQAAPNSIYENLYGPTELTITCFVYRWEKDKPNASYNGSVPIGKVYDHLKYIVVNENCERVDDEGELCVTGSQRFTDYLNATESKPYFIAVKDENDNPLCYYRTGDRVKLAPSGDVLYLGRIDHQVKINGYRVELGEIESVLGKMNGVERALAFYISTQEEPQNKKLVSYVIGEVSVDEVISHAKKILPIYMVPSQVKVEKSLPLNFNGKIDRKLIAMQFTENSNF